MADFSALKAAIQAAIRQNGNNEITGNIMQGILLSIVNTLGDAAINALVDAVAALSARVADGYMYGGIATPTSTPTVSSGKVFYVALQAGTYTNYGALVVGQGISILKTDNVNWTLDVVWLIDNKPTAGSNNLVKSGGSKSYVDNLVSSDWESSSLLPHNSFNNLDLDYIGYFTNQNIARKIMNDDYSLNPYYVEYFIYKTTSNSVTIYLYRYDGDENEWVSTGESITLNVASSMLAPEYGANVYKIPYFNVINAVPFVHEFYFISVVDADNVGYVDISRKPYPPADEPDNQREIGFGVIGKESPIPLIKKDIPLIKKEISDIKNSVYGKLTLVPHNSFDDLTDGYAAEYFCSLNIAKRMLNEDYSITPLYVDYFIYKPTPLGGNTLELYLHSYNGTSWVLESQITLNLDSSMLAPEYGANTYKVPFHDTLRYVPFVKHFYYTAVQDDNNVGYMDSAQTPFPTADSPDNKREIGFGMLCTIDNIQDLENKVNAISLSKWKNKKIVFFGDSITYQGYYIDSYVERTGCTALRYGVSGSHISASSSADISAFQYRVSSLPNDADMVIVFGGTNDYGHSDSSAVPFGSFTDYLDTSLFTFYSGLHSTMHQLYEKYKGKPVIIMTPLHHGYELDNPEVIFNNDGTLTMGTNPVSGKTFKEYVDAIKEVAAYYSFYVIDAYSESGMNPCLETSQSRFYFYDGLHPNQKGGIKLADYMYPLLEQVYDMFYKKAPQ